MNPRQFLLLGGIVLVVLALAGFTVLGPDNALLGNAFYLDMAENVAHLVLGVVALGAYFALKDDKLVRWLVILVGVIAAVVAVLGFINSGAPAPNLGVTNLELLDDVLHLVVAVWAFAVAFMKKPTGGGMAEKPASPAM